MSASGGLELQHLVYLNGGARHSNKDLLSRINQTSCPFLGIILATLSSFFFSLCSVIVKWMTNVHPMVLASFRFIGVLMPTIPILIRKEVAVFPKGKRILLILRCFLGTNGLMLSFYAFQKMSLADASVIIFSTPVFVVIFAKLFLKESCGLFHIITVFLTLIGVIFITRPPLLFNNNFNDKTTVPLPLFRNGSVEGNIVPDVLYDGRERYFEGGLETDSSPPYEIWGPVAAVSSTLFGANAYVLLRALKGLHFSVIMSNFGSFALVYTLLISYFVFGQLCLPVCGTDRYLVVALALFSFLGQILLTLALQMEQAGPVSLARSSDIVFAFIWQMIFFDESPNEYSLIGAALVIVSVLLTALRKWLLTLPTDSQMRQRLHVLAKE